MLKDMIRTALEDKVNEIFLQFQNEMGIENGDVSPLDFLQIESLQDEMVTAIANAITSQARENGRIFYDVDNDSYITIVELERDYNEMINDGTLDRDIYSTFSEYLNACMDYNNGSLTEV